MAISLLLSYNILWISFTSAANMDVPLLLFRHLIISGRIRLNSSTQARVISPFTWLKALHDDFALWNGRHAVRLILLDWKIIFNMIQLIFILLCVPQLLHSGQHESGIESYRWSRSEVGSGTTEPWSWRESSHSVSISIFRQVSFDRSVTSWSRLMGSEVWSYTKALRRRCVVFMFISVFSMLHSLIESAFHFLLQRRRLCT